MRCFDHPDHEAIGICKSCAKGLCVDCAVDLGKGLACKDRCEADVHEIIKIIRTSASAKLPLNQLSTGVFFVVMGTVFSGWGLASKPTSLFTVILGLLFVASGAFNIYRAYRIKAEVRGNSPSA